MPAGHSAISQAVAQSAKSAMRGSSGVAFRAAASALHHRVEQRAKNARACGGAFDDATPSYRSR
jgi:hypothetical protein